MLNAKILCCRLNFLQSIITKVVGIQIIAARNNGNRVTKTKNFSWFTTDSPQTCDGRSEDSIALAFDALDGGNLEGSDVVIVKDNMPKTDFLHELLLSLFSFEIQRYKKSGGNNYQ